MSLPDLPLNDQIAEFGFAWHGRHVRPLTGEPYIELPSGRRIAGVGDQLSPSTYLADNGMPEVQAQLADPEAALWRVGILNGSGEGGFTCWTKIVTARRVRVGQAWRAADPSLANFGSYALLTSSGVPSVQLSFAQLGGVPADFNSFTVEDVSPDGRRWLLAVRNSFFGTTPYRIDLSTSTLYSLVEVEFNAAVTAMTLRVVASYAQCAGTVLQSQPGADYEQRIRFLRFDASGKTGEGDYLYNPSAGGPADYGEPISCSTSSGYPCSESFRYSVGTSTAIGEREYVLTGWYTAAGVLQVVRVRVLEQVQGVKSTPGIGPGGRYYWDNTVITRTVTASVSIDGGAFAPYFEYRYVVDESPSATVQTLTVGTDAAQFSTTQTHTAPTVHQTVPAVREQAPAPALVVATSLAGTALTMHVAFRMSNRVRGALLRCEASNYCEYIASSAVTPSGLDAGYRRTGNVWPGDRNDRANFSLALWNNHFNFQAGSHNPVTGQVVRNQLGGDRYTWV